jgi:predicted TIM-barrel fold metal-dependent hydrolase
MFIDMHAHAYSHPSPPQDGISQFGTPEQVLRFYDRNDIECGVLMPLIGPEYYLPQSNEEILQTCERYKGRFIPFCNLDPRGIRNSPDTDFSIWLKWYKDHGFKGVGEFMPNLPFTDPLVLNFFRQVEAFGFPLTFDISDRIGGRYGLYDDPGLPQLEECLKLFPKLIIIGHGPAFWSEIGVLETGDSRGSYIQHPVLAEGAVYRLFRNYPNMWADLSAGSGHYALVRDEANAVKFLDEFQDRLMYGTDICNPQDVPDTRSFLLKLLNEGKLSGEAFDKIARKNACHLLGLK